jgi:F-type H+-transporting ATPase subunit b
MFESPEFWVAIAFALTVGLLARPTYRAVRQALDSRIQSIRDRVDEAARLREEAQQLLAAHQRKQREAQREAATLLAHAHEQAAALKAEATRTLEAALARRRHQAADKIARAEEEAAQEVRRVVVEVAMRAARAMIREGLDRRHANLLVDHAIDELPARLQL